MAYEPEDVAKVGAQLPLYPAKYSPGDLVIHIPTGSVWKITGFYGLSSTSLGQRYTAILEEPNSNNHSYMWAIGAPGILYDGNTEPLVQQDPAGVDGFFW